MKTTRSRQTSSPRALHVAECVFVAVAIGFLLSFPIRVALRGLGVRQTVALDDENRAAKLFPDLGAVPAKGFGRAVEGWYDDAMPSRRWLLRRARAINLKVLRSPFGVYIPGCGNQWFRTGGEWPELEDYLGAFRLNDEQLDRWADLFVGRRAWAEAMGCEFVTVISPPKVQAMPDAPYPWISRNRGTCLFEQVAAHLERRGETNAFVSLRSALRDPVDGRPLFLLKADHHPDPEGLYRMYEAIAAAIPGCGVVPWFSASPPPAVLAGRDSGCWTDGRRLHVSTPGSVQVNSPFLALAPASTPAPNQRSVAVRRGNGSGLYVVLAHTSYMRYTLSSWDDASASVSFPFDGSVGQVDSLLWKHLGEADLDYLTSEAVPDAIVQEINEWHLSGQAVGWCDAIRNAATFARGASAPAGESPAPDAPVSVRAILVDVKAGGFSAMPLRKNAPCAVATLYEGDSPRASMRVRPGIRRPVFFPPVPFGSGAFRVGLSGGSARLASIEVRVPAQE